MSEYKSRIRMAIMEEIALAKGRDPKTQAFHPNSPDFRSGKVTGYDMAANRILSRLENEFHINFDSEAEVKTKSETKKTSKGKKDSEITEEE